MCVCVCVFAKLFKQNSKLFYKFVQINKKTVQEYIDKGVLLRKEKLLMKNMTIINEAVFFLYLFFYDMNSHTTWTSLSSKRNQIMLFLFRIYISLSLFFLEE